MKRSTALSNDRLSKLIHAKIVNATLRTCKRQFPDCPPEYSAEDPQCKHCPYSDKNIRKNDL